jgi:hypothetical protein
LPDIISIIRDICTKEQVVIVGANECYKDGVIIVKNGMEATLLNGWESIDFNKIHNRVTSGKAKPSKRGNIVESYGYSTASYDKVIDSDGLHPPSVKSNTINKPDVGSQFVAL